MVLSSQSPVTSISLHHSSRFPGHVESATHVSHPCYPAVSQSVDLGQNNNPNTTPTKDYKNVQVVVYLHGVQRGCAEEGERGSTPIG